MEYSTGFARSIPHFGTSQVSTAYILNLLAEVFEAQVGDKALIQ
jgi:hypothetical protein